MAYFLLHIHCLNKTGILFRNVQKKCKNEELKMIKVANYNNVTSIALRQKGWKLFGAVLLLQIMMVSAGYLFRLYG